jgi:transposase
VILLANPPEQGREKYEILKEKRRPQVKEAGKPMSMHPQPIAAIPEETARVARTIFPQGNVYMQMRDEFGSLYTDEDFSDLFPLCGQPAEAPWQLALVTLMQFAEGLTDRQAADAVRTRIDWKYALSLELTSPGFDFSVLSEFRSRLLASGAERRLFDLLLQHFRERGWMKARGKQRTDSTHVLAAIRTLRRLELVGETMRHALNVLAEVAPAWLLQHLEPSWAERYEKRFSDFRLPKDKTERVALAQQIGADGRALYEHLGEEQDLTWLKHLEAVEILRQVWLQQYHASPEGAPWRDDNELPPSALLITSPYDVEARFARKKSTSWTGYKVHLTETCDADTPHLIVEVMTTTATLPDGEVVGDVHEHLEKQDLLPGQHLVDTGYIDAKLLAESQHRYHVDLFGPVMPDLTWQTREQKGFDHRHFSVDWSAHRVTCPAGQVSQSWGIIPDRHGSEVVRVRFPLPACRSCPSHDACTTSPARVLIFQPTQEAYEALQEARDREKTSAFRALYAKRAGIEGTVAQTVRTCELRQARYIGKKKLHLQALFTATAVNVLRACDWVSGQTPASTPVSRFAKLMASVQSQAVA